MSLGAAEEMVMDIKAGQIWRTNGSLQEYQIHTCGHPWCGVVKVGDKHNLLVQIQKRRFGSVGPDGLHYVRG